MAGVIRSRRRPGRSGAGTRMGGPARPALRCPVARRRSSRGFFSPSQTQQMAGSLGGRVPLADLGAAAATLGTLLLWGLALHLLA